MSTKIITEEELRNRLIKSGKLPETIDALIDKHIDATSGPAINTDAISDMLRKAQHDSVYRVRAFKLTKQQYDALQSYFEDPTALQLGSEPDASSLVQRALEAFINLIG
jgi:hypothetical protein